MDTVAGKMMLLVHALELIKKIIFPALVVINYKNKLKKKKTNLVVNKMPTKCGI